MDFRVGGAEYNNGTFYDGIKHAFKTTYYDIVPEQRIVYVYEVYLNEERISVSVATLEFRINGNKTDAMLHESGVFLDGLDTPESREKGTNYLMDALKPQL